MKTRLLTAVAFVSAVVLCAPPARADPVTIDFTWTRFESVMEPPNMGFTDVFVETDVAKTPIFPVQGVPFSIPITSNNDRVDFYAGVSTHNAASFVAGPTANINEDGQIFLFGTLFVENGTWFGPADLVFTMTTVSPNGALDGHTYTDTLRLTTNPFVFGDPAAGADTFSLVALNQSVRVYELFDSPLIPPSNAGSFEIWGRIGSLIPLEIRNVQGAAFQPITAPVPEPSEALLMLSGLAGIALLAKRRRRSPAR
jgi:hypothetical protein